MKDRSLQKYNYCPTVTGDGDQILAIAQDCMGPENREAIASAHRLYVSVQKGY